MSGHKKHIKRAIDTHIHIDQYIDSDVIEICGKMSKEKIQAVIAVSTNIKSAERILNLQNLYPQIKLGIGYHPEQKLPTKNERAELFEFIAENQEHLTTIGEVGLPHYLSFVTSEMYEQYIELLEQFIIESVRYDLPINLHAIYEGAEITLDLLEKYDVARAHFHWFKGSERSLYRIIEKKYYVSITPDVLYRQRTRDMVAKLPLDCLLVETDGPWRFQEVYEDQLTVPWMIHDVIKEISIIKQSELEHVYDIIYENVLRCYQLDM